MDDGSGLVTEACLETPLTPDIPEPSMLTTVAIVLVILWALGLVGGFQAGGLIHLLLMIALVVIVLRVLSGRQAL